MDEQSILRVNYVVLSKLVLVTAGPEGSMYDAGNKNIGAAKLDKTTMSGREV